MVPIGELKPHGKNPNRHSEEQVKRLAKNMREPTIGIRHPIIVSNRSGCIVAGHGRLESFRELGLKEVPVSYQDFESDDAEYAFMVSDNALHNWSELDLGLVNMELENLGPDFDLDFLGLNNFKLDFNLDSFSQEIGKLSDSFGYTLIFPKEYQQKIETLDRDFVTETIMKLADQK